MGNGKHKGQIEVLKLAKIRPRVLNMADAARYVGMAYNTLKNQRSNNTFPVQARIRGGKPFWLIEELDEYIDSLPR
jgi:predicted DNA-binding transcriptional regulator AlpA